MNMYIWAINTSNQLSIKYSCTQLNFQKKKKKEKEIASGKTPFFVIGPFCILHSIYLHIWFFAGQF